MLTRALGARDLVLAAGAVQAIAAGEEGEARRWFIAQAVADAMDLVATLRVRESLPAEGVKLGLEMAGASTAIALTAAAKLELG